ncbi:MAG: sigma-70 family RNA polymerase sigma factor [Bacteroidota bacterium]|uniref:RNA polymerase sigma factor n=1 Tax=Parabacteroides sp. FAFU027 TaxID=2922715 RepID=UPI001FAFF03D|nr:sigma-70 family RNA polymerase sigma factor [Parabacteroides sp. FAFU027]MDP4270554.1 sigma-70 family RNA polymerase sigma factor [Bacteroidota bacterium]
MLQYDERLLVTQLKEGNKSAFEKLYQKYSAKLYNSISLLLHNKSIAKDITQNCFLIVWEKRNLLNPDKSFPAYLYTIARNLVYKETERQVLNTKFIETSLNHLETFEDNTIENLNNTYLEEYLNNLVNELPCTPQKIFILKKDNELTNKEIATQLEITERAVEAHLYRTTKHLKEKLKYFMMNIFLFM